MLTLLAVLPLAFAAPITSDETPGTCLEVLYRNINATDGNYELDCEGNKFVAYCHDMASGKPSEFLTLVSGEENNFAEYFAHQSDPSKTTVLSKYAKIRVNPCTLAVDVANTKFAVSTGSLRHGSRTFTSWDYGVAASCEQGQSQPGHSRIDLTGTPFFVKSEFKPNGNGAYGQTTSDDNKQVFNISGGGFCGQNAPVGWDQFAPANASQWVLQLGYAFGLYAPSENRSVASINSSQQMNMTVIKQVP
eukprot:m.92239 g.92239  ORF g.92239 m.92239 type:complete len:248 (-) comp21704_c0_seq9:37-780(-)